MGDRSAIEWTGATWNPLRARLLEAPGEVGWICVRVSAGCVNCYAATMNAWRGNGEDYTVPGLDRVDPFLDLKALTLPLRWKAPRKIFVCSMTDLFGEWVPDEWIWHVYGIMSAAPQHTFQILTKRPARMLEVVSKITGAKTPCPNVWLGVSVEDQATADARIPLLLQTPAAVRWVSYEPALRPVDFRPFLPLHFGHPDDYNVDSVGGLDWVVVGGESGPGARPFDLAWARSMIAQCRATGVPVFVKQLGSLPVEDLVHGSDGSLGYRVFGYRDPGPYRRLNDRKGGDPTEWPEDLRAREYPPAAVRA